MVGWGTANKLFTFLKDIPPGTKKIPVVLYSDLVFFSPASSTIAKRHFGPRMNIDRKIRFFSIIKGLHHKASS